MGNSLVREVRSEPFALELQGMTILHKPDEATLREHLKTDHLVAKILRHLDPVTGDESRPGEVRCTEVLVVGYNPYQITAVYATARLDEQGRTVTGTQFARFFPWSAVMRCLAVTITGDVVLIDQYRRGRGAWVRRMHVAGGVRQGDIVHAATRELITESGVQVTDESTITSIDGASGPGHFMDDGIFQDKLHLLVVDRVAYPRSHQRLSESITSIGIMPWSRWQRTALSGESDDIYATIFAARCRFDDTNHRVVVRGRKTVLRKPVAPA